MNNTYTPSIASHAARVDMRRFRTISAALDDTARRPRTWRRFTAYQVGRAAVAATLSGFGLTAAEAALILAGLPDDLTGLRLQLSKTPRDGLIVDQQREGLPPWPARLCAIVVDAGAIAARAVARLPVQEARESTEFVLERNDR